MNVMNDLNDVHDVLLLAAVARNEWFLPVETSGHWGKYRPSPLQGVVFGGALTENRREAERLESQAAANLRLELAS